MATVFLDDPVERVVRLADPKANPADRILAAAGGRHQDILAKLDDAQAVEIRNAYERSRKQIVQRMDSLWARTFGAGLPVEPKHTIEWARGGELLGQIDRHLDTLGFQAQALQGQAYNAGAQLGFDQANVELGMALPDFGGAGKVGKAVFGSLDTLVPDLGMAAAVNETQNLSNELKTAVHGALVEGAVLGEGITKMVARLDPILGGATVAAGNRAELISRWAVIKGHNAARSQAFTDAAEYIPGLQQMWLVTKDERTCPHCMAHWGEVVDAGGEFDQDRTFAGTAPKIYGGVLEYPPLHPRCRCTITAWHERWRGLATNVPEDFQAQAQELAQKSGLPAKTFVPPKPSANALRATRKGRAVIRAQAIKGIPDGVRKATMERFLSCWVGGGG